MTPEEQESMVQDLETSLDRLQALYNQYFMGIERLEPTVQRKEVERKVQILRREKLSNTALRFRFQTQVQKFNTQSNYWKRISRQIEEGTYQRDVNRAQKRSERRDEAELAERALSSLDGPVPFQPRSAMKAPAAPQLDLDDPFADARPDAQKAQRDPDKTPIPAVGSEVHAVNERLIRTARIDAVDDEDEDLSSFFSKRSSVAPPAPAPITGSHAMPAPQPEQSAPRPQLPRPKGISAAQAESVTRPVPVPTRARTASPEVSSTALSEERMQAIYRTYLAARKKTNEPTDNVSFAKIEALLKKQVAEKSDIKDFKVVIRDGKAIIKTVKD